MVKLWPLVESSNLNLFMDKLKYWLRIRARVHDMLKRDARANAPSIY